MKITKEQLQQFIKEELATAVVPTTTPAANAAPMKQEAPEMPLRTKSKPRRKSPVAFVKFAIFIPVYQEDLPEGSEPPLDSSIEDTADKKLGQMSGESLAIQLEYEDTIDNTKEE